MTLRIATWTVLALLLVTGRALSEDEKATMISGAGIIRLGDGADAPRFKAGKDIPRGTPLNLGEDAEASIVFTDGSEMNLRGPARIRLVEMTPTTRRIDVSKGRINSFSVGGVTTGIHTPHDAFAVLRNGTISVNVEKGQTTFLLFDGDDAKVLDVGADKTVVLAPNTPYVVGAKTQDAKPKEIGPKEAGQKETGPGTQDLRRIRIGDRLIKLSPADGWTVAETDTGGVTLTCNVPADEFGSVQLDVFTVFYVQGGSSMQMDSSGNVVAHQATVHTQVSLLDPRNIYDQAFAPPADSSPVTVR